LHTGFGGDSIGHIHIIEGGKKGKIRGNIGKEQQNEQR